MSDKNIFRQRICEGCGMPIYSDGLCAHCEQDTSADKLPEWVMVPREPTEAMLEAGWNAPASTRYLESTRAVWTAMLAAAPQREVVVDDALVEIGARAICAANGWDADERVRYSGGKLVRNKDGSFVPQWKMHETDARAAIAAALTHPQGDNDGK